jgi:hypothetical protein
VPRLDVLQLFEGANVVAKFKPSLGGFELLLVTAVHGLSHTAKQSCGRTAVYGYCRRAR